MYSRILGGIYVRVFELGTPSRRMFEKDNDGLMRANMMISRLNGVTNLYRTLYDFWRRPAWETAFVDKAFFDFDPDDKGNELKDARKMHEYLAEKNILHYPYFSGRGFHIFAMIEETPSWKLSNPTTAMRKLHQEHSLGAGVKPDPATKDLVRIARIPNTINLKTKLFCVPLDYDELYLNKSEIEEIAKKQRKVDWECLYTNKIDFENYDCAAFEVEYAPVKGKIEVDEKALRDRLPKCVLNQLSDGWVGYFERFPVIMALKELALSEEEARKILEKYLHEEKYEHCIFVENQLHKLYKRDDLFFPNCDTLKMDGLCVEGCTGHNLYVE
jgi:hypothetical protein